MKSVKHAIIPIVFTLLGFLIYSNVLYGPFLFDDEMYIADNYRIQNISNFLKDFSGTRYIGFLSFALNYYFGGLNIFGYHIVNILIHIINTLLVYLLVQITLNKVKSINDKASAHLDYLPFAVSLIFLVHPIQTQAVSYITQRFASLATLFYILSLVLYVKARGYGLEHRHSQDSPIAYHPLPIAFYVLSIISAVLAMKTKEISFTLPLVIALYEFIFFKSPLTPPFIRGRRGGIERFLYLLPFFLTLLIIPLELFWPKDTDMLASGADVGEMTRQLQLKDIKDGSVYNYFITQFRVIVTYMRLLVLPVNQTFEYDYTLSKSIFEPATFISFIFLLIIFSSAVYLYFRSRITHHAHGLLISFGILWFLITLSVESSIIPIGNVIFEHRLYLPSVGFILSAATVLFYGIEHLEKRINRSLWDYLLAVVVIAAVILSFSTYRRNILWGDKYLMWLDNVNKAPNRAGPHENLGNVYLKQGRLDEAINEFLIASKLRPDHVNAHYNLGVVFLNQGRIDGAINEFLIASKLRPEHAEAHNDLGIAYFEQGRLDEAIKEYMAALKLKSDHPDPDIHYNLGLAYYNQGRIDEAIKEYVNAIRLKLDHPDPDIHYNLGLAYKVKGLKYEARKEFEAVLKINPNDADARQAIEFLEK